MQSIEARCYVESEYVVGAAPAGLINNFIVYQGVLYQRFEGYMDVIYHQ